MAERAARDIAETMRALVDTLVPGDDRFPSASAAGVHGVVAERLRAQAGRSQLDRVLAALDSDARRFAASNAAERGEAVKRFEHGDPALFEALLTTVYLAYYESPSVVCALRGLGRAYNDTPQPDGYAMAAFDATDPAQAPTHTRGRYVATDEVARVDLAPIAANPLAPERVAREAGVETGRGPLSRGTRGGES